MDPNHRKAICKVILKVASEPKEIDNSVFNKIEDIHSDLYSMFGQTIKDRFELGDKSVEALKHLFHKIAKHYSQKFYDQNVHKSIFTMIYEFFFSNKEKKNPVTKSMFLTYMDKVMHNIDFARHNIEDISSEDRETLLKDCSSIFLNWLRRTV